MIVELKAVERIAPEHRAQVINYLTNDRKEAGPIRCEAAASRRCR